MKVRTKLNSNTCEYEVVRREHGEEISFRIKKLTRSRGEVATSSLMISSWETVALGSRLEQLYNRSISLGTSKIINEYLEEDTGKYIERIELEVRKGEPKLMAYRRGARKPVPISLLGDGYKVLVGVEIAVASAQDIVILEEPENHTHPALQDKILSRLTNWLKGGSRQLIITTHSIELLNKLLGVTEQENLPGAVHRVCRRNSEVIVDTVPIHEATELVYTVQADLRQFA
ncbi:MAG: hypothetical protein DRJ40_09590 [Thermoprotei archaeon]|nr:MAG: hypothetical protein DRJ40_09590 [Thermoprotei archaeon]